MLWLRLLLYVWNKKTVFVFDHQSGYWCGRIVASWPGYIELESHLTPGSHDTHRTIVPSSKIYYVQENFLYGQKQHLEGCLELGKRDVERAFDE